MRLWLVLLACAIAIGAGLGSIAPESWRLAPADGLLVGAALYMAAWRRFVERREWGEAGGRVSGAGDRVSVRGGSPGWGGLLAGLSLRAALFLALVCAQAFLCFQVIPDLDVRRGFVVLSAWVVMLALVDAGPERVPTAASPPSFR